MATRLEEIDAAIAAAKARQAEVAKTTGSAAVDAEIAARQPGSSDRLGQAIGSGARKGAEGFLGFSADLSSLVPKGVKRGSNLLAKALQSIGIDAPGLPEGSEQEAIFDETTRPGEQLISQLGTSAIRENITDPYLGKNDFKPQSTSERYVESIAEALPNAGGRSKLITKLADVLLGGVGAQAGEDVTKGTRLEDYGRLIGGVAGVAPSLAFRGKTGPSGAAVYDDAVTTLEETGQTLSAGQRTNHPIIRAAENTLGGTAFGKMRQGQTDLYGIGKMGDIGYPGRMPTPDNLRRARMEIGGRMDNLAASTNVPFGPGLNDDLRRVADNHRMANGQPAPGVEQMRQTIIDAATNNPNNPGFIDGAAYQKITTRLRELSEAAGNSENADAFQSLRDVLDDALGRTMPPEQLAKWDKARTDYRGLKDIERELGLNAKGEVTPQDMRTSLINKYGETPVVEETHPFAKEANAGTKVLTDQPTGAVATAAAHTIPAVTMAASGMGAGPSLMALAAPFIAGNVLMDPHVQALMAPSDKMRQALAAILAGSTATDRNRPPQYKP